MNKSPRTKASTARKAVASAKSRRTAKPGVGRAKRRSKVDIAIATELAPAAAIAVLDKAAQASGSPSPALDVLGAGVSEATDAGNVRVQLVFDNGAVLPVEMSDKAGEALEAGLAENRRSQSRKK